MDGLSHGSGSGSTAKDDGLLLLLMLRMLARVELLLRVLLVHVRGRVLLLLLLLMRTWLHVHLLLLLLLCGMLSVDGRLHGVGSAGRHWSLMLLLRHVLLHVECIVGHHLGSREQALRESLRKRGVGLGTDGRTGASIDQGGEYEPRRIPTSAIDLWHERCYFTEPKTIRRERASGMIEPQECGPVCGVMMAEGERDRGVRVIGVGSSRHGPACARRRRIRSRLSQEWLESKRGTERGTRFGLTIRLDSKVE